MTAGYIPNPSRSTSTVTCNQSYNFNDNGTAIIDGTAQYACIGMLWYSRLSIHDVWYRGILSRLSYAFSIYKMYKLCLCFTARDCTVANVDPNVVTSTCTDVPYGANCTQTCAAGTIITLIYQNIWTYICTCHILYDMLYIVRGPLVLIVLVTIRCGIWREWI